MTQKKVSHERVVELLDLDLFYYERRRGDLIKVPCDRKDAVWARSGTTEHRLDSIDFTNPAWTGPLLVAYAKRVRPTRLDWWTVMSKLLAVVIDRAGIEIEVFNTAIIEALDALEKEK